MTIATATEKTRRTLTLSMRRACASLVVDVPVDVLVELEVLKDEVEVARVEELVLEVVGLELVELEDPELEVPELKAFGLELLAEPLLETRIRLGHWQAQSLRLFLLLPF